MRIVSLPLFLMLVFSCFISCKKEESFEVGASASGSLKSGANGDCLPKTAVGSYIAGTAIPDSNYLEIEVDVASEGAYSIRTDTVNGYSFSGSGNFAQTGVNRIRLAGSGTPIAAGQDQFAVIFDTSICFVPVTVLPAGSSGPAEFTLQGNGDSCMAAVVSGDYVQNVALSGTNTVAIKVNVTTPGTFTVTTNNVNDFSFSGSGTLATAGENTITLTASGTPAIEGSTVFTVTAGGTTCAFSVNVTASDEPPVNTGDLFPLSVNSRWSYIFDPSAPNDTLEVTNVGSLEIEGNTYQNFEYTDPDIPFDSLFFRKSGGDYFQYADVNALIADLETDVKGDILFLKENPNAGDTWNTDFPTTAGGNPITLRFAFTCTAANTTATVNGRTFNGVYKITAKIQTGIGGVFTDAGPSTETYYARGVGMIREIANEQAGDFELQLKNYEVK